MNHHFAEVLKIVLVTLKIDTKELASLLGVDQWTVKRWIDEKYYPPLRKRLVYMQQLKQLIREGAYE